MKVSFLDTNSSLPHSLGPSGQPSSVSALRSRLTTELAVGSPTSEAALADRENKPAQEPPQRRFYTSGPRSQPEENINSLPLPHHRTL